MGVYRAKKHDMRFHHRFIVTALVSMTLAVASMIYQSRGLPTLHGKLGISIYSLILITVLSGKLFLNRRINRNQHKAIALFGIVLLLFMILNGLFTFVF